MSQTNVQTCLDQVIPLCDYQTWIDLRLLAGDPWNQCREWTVAMQADFTELIPVRGQVLLSNGWERDHWWLITPTGDVVDPTASQFSAEYFGGSRIVIYLPRDESQPEPTGMCPNCGGLCFDGGTCCSDRCHGQYVAYCMRGF